MFEESVALARCLGLDGVVEFAQPGARRNGAGLSVHRGSPVSPDPKSPLNDVSSMNKVVEYMAMSRPVVSFDLYEARVTAGRRRSTPPMMMRCGSRS